MYSKPPFPNDKNETIGVLLVNLGTPDAPDTGAVRRYLAEFLGDPRVVETPRLIWKPLLHGVILRTRPRRSAAAYRKVWTEDGSPLLSISRDQEKALSEALGTHKGFNVALGMRYGSPSIAEALDRLRESNARKIVILPLYPQYSATTTATVFDAVSDELRKWRWLPELRFINDYATDPAYIGALADSIRAYWSDHGRPEKLVMSFHGIPRAYADNGDPYPLHCRQTAEALAEQLGLESDQWIQTFQSRVGPKEWLQPYTDETMEKLGKEGVKNIQVVCPGFSVDCLETLEEIAIENRDYFLEAGGETFGYIPALNANPAHIAMMVDLVRRHSHGWKNKDEDHE